MIGTCHLLDAPGRRPFVAAEEEGGDHDRPLRPSTSPRTSTTGSPVRGARIVPAAPRTAPGGLSLPRPRRPSPAILEPTDAAS